MAQPRILVVDDDESIAFLLCARLKSYGFRTVAVNSGEEALRYLEKNLPDLIMLDYLMPGMDGCEVLKKIRSEKSISHIPVIMLTAKHDQSCKIEGFKMGLDDFMLKPYDPEELAGRIKAVLRRAKPPVLKKIKNILITGGAGFIGSALARELLKRKYRIAIIDDFSTGRRSNVKDMLGNKNFQLITGSITDEALVSKAVEKCDLIYHLAATVGVKNVVEKPLDTIIYDTVGTSIVLKYASPKGVKVVLTSTSEVYGKSKKYPFREDDDVIIGPPGVNRWSYACSKLLDEFMVKAYHDERGLPAVVVRFFNIVGPGQVGSYGMVIPRFFKSALNNEPIHIYGDGEQIRCFTYVDDAIDILVKLADNEKANGEIINLGSNNQISIKELALTIKRLTKSSSKIVFEPYRKYYGEHFEDVKKREPDLTKLKKIIGFTPKTGIQEILEKILHYFEENPEELNNI
ncbi:MAG: GDP-mannose 4,6-dehydratase [Candidatus Omnitrophica bacterium]|nr:GDP-mannose 4,6-dehydratase [Candidatus Omnitrophota bacterium]